MTTEIHGFCDNRFQGVKEAFAANFADGIDVGASFAVMHNGKPLVDLWAGHADFDTRTRPWDENTIVVIHSTTKIAIVLSFLMLVDRGLVALDATVASYWPEFGAGGKGHVTVREALSHRAGVPGFNTRVPLEFVLDWDACVANIAAQDHWFGGESVHCYHSATFGYVLGEIMRRVDGRRPTQFFREEIAARAGIDMQIGLSALSDRARVADCGFLKPPMPFGDPRPEDPVEIRAITSWGAADATALPAFYRKWENQRADYPSGNAFANARSIARLCAIPAAGGTLDGVRYISKALIDEASSLQVEANDSYLGTIRMGLGFGLDSPTFPSPTPTCFHWGGYGGSFGTMDQATGISAGYAMNNWYVGAGRDRRRVRLWKALGAAMADLAAQG